MGETLPRILREWVSGGGGGEGSYLSEEIDFLSRCLDSVAGWIEANKLKLDPDNMKSLLIGRKGKNYGRKYNPCLNKFLFLIYTYYQIF